mmetsp:Transcript_39092/g.103318  ORF Transcript_39092/g.103318 Transcript_39092/m.103318 type:complete len:158 (+) Transcript_39092:93-566(+)
MAQRRSSVGVCLVLAASLFGFAAFVQPAVLGRPVVGARLSAVALQAGAREQGGGEDGASWRMPLVAAAAALGLVLSLPGPAQAAWNEKSRGGVDQVNEEAKRTKDDLPSATFTNSLEARMALKTLDFSVSAQKTEDVQRAVEEIQKKAAEEKAKKAS